MSAAYSPRRRMGRLTVTHPILGTPLEIGTASIRLAPGQYLALADCLCNLAFLCPHQAPRILDLAREIGVTEVVLYIGWMREADQYRHWHKGEAA